MSLHELLLRHQFYGIGFWSVAGLFSTILIAASCISRLNAMRPTRWWRLTLEQLLYLLFSAWAMEAFTDLVFLRMFSGFDVAIGGVILLHLRTTYKLWIGDDWVGDLVSYWNADRRRRIAEVRRGIKFGRRRADKH